MKIPEELRITLVRTAVALCLLILYLLSVGPAFYLGMDRGESWNIFRTLYGPAFAVADSSKPYSHYIRWWQRKHLQALLADYRRSQLKSKGPETGSR